MAKYSIPNSAIRKLLKDNPFGFDKDNAPGYLPGDIYRYRVGVNGAIHKCILKRVGFAKEDHFFWEDVNGDFFDPNDEPDRYGDYVPEWLSEFAEAIDN